MSFKLKREAIPEELPDLGIGELKEKLAQIEKQTLPAPIVPVAPIIPAAPVTAAPVNPAPISSIPVVEPPIQHDKPLPKVEDTFFKEMLKNIDGEMNDLKELDSLYNHKFIPKDVVSEMKEYWEKQKPNQIVELVGKKFKEDLTKKINQLETLEKEWRQASLQLIEKESEIREEEKELKRILAEFVKACKEKLKNGKERS